MDEAISTTAYNRHGAKDLKAETKERRIKPLRRRTRRPSLNNEELLDKALDLFFEHGYERTSVETITATAGMAKRTVYLRYGDKKSLFKEALQRAIDQWIVPVERLQAAERDTLEDSLLTIGQILVDNVLSPAGLRLLRLTNAESGRMPEIGEYAVRRGTDRTIAYLATLFRRHLGQDSAHDVDADEAAEALAEAFLHLVVGGPANAAAWGVVRGRDAINRRVRFSVRLFLHGLLLLPGRKAALDPVMALKNDYLRLKKAAVQAVLQLDLARECLEGAQGVAARPEAHSKA